MPHKLIHIQGITPFDYYPDCIDVNQTIFLCEQDLLTIPCQKPDAYDILDLSYYIELLHVEERCSPLGTFYILKMNKCIKIMYESDTAQQSVHTAHFSIPFSAVYTPSCPCEIHNFFVAIHDIDACLLDCRQVNVQAIISISNVSNPCDCDCDCDCEPMQHPNPYESLPQLEQAWLRKKQREMRNQWVEEDELVEENNVEEDCDCEEQEEVSDEVNEVIEFLEEKKMKPPLVRMRQPIHYKKKKESPCNNPDTSPQCEKIIQSSNFAPRWTDPYSSY